MTKPEDLSSHLKKNVDFLIDEGMIKGKPSRIIKVTDNNQEILRL